MIIKDTFSKLTNISKLSGCIAFFTNEKSEISHLKKYLSSSDFNNFNILLKNKNKKTKQKASYHCVGRNSHEAIKPEQEE